MSSKISGLREFGKFRLDAERKVLWYENQPVNLPLKQIEMLCVLTERGGAVVTKDEILEKVWGDSFVEESNLSRHVYVLRKTFEKLGADRNLIETVPRRGYRFAGEVRPLENGEMVIEKHTLTRTTIEFEEKTEERGKNKFFFSRLPSLATAALLAVLLAAGAFFGYQEWQARASAPEIKSIAVLPFKTIDADEENEYQGLGLADVLITRLSNLREIGVRPTSAVSSFDDQTEDSISFGKKLQVDAVLEGSIYRTAEKVRVTARLVKTSDGAAVWTGQFEKIAVEELKIQDEIALQVANALALNLSGGEKNALTRHYTENRDAQQLYAKGRYEWSKRNWQGMLDAEQSFRQAVNLDPNFALAYVGLSDTLAMRSDAREAKINVEKALELDPHLAEAHASLGFILMFQEWNWREAEKSLQKAVELNPNYATAHHWHAQVLTIQGRHEEAKSAMRRALEINPISHNFLADLGQIYYFNREYGEAEEYCKKALEIYPDFIFGHEYLYDIYLKTGEHEKAVEEIIKATKINLTFASQTDERKRTLEERFERERKIFREAGIMKYIENSIEAPDAVFYYINAGKYAFLGEREKALDLLEKSYEQRAFLSVFIKADPIFEDLRDEPRYREILRKMNLE